MRLQKLCWRKKEGAQERKWTQANQTGLVPSVSGGAAALKYVVQWWWQGRAGAETGRAGPTGAGQAGTPYLSTCHLQLYTSRPRSGFQGKE